MYLPHNHLVLFKYVWTRISPALSETKWTPITSAVRNPNEQLSTTQCFTNLLLPDTPCEEHWKHRGGTITTIQKVLDLKPSQRRLIHE